ncbi:MAG: hypothetical protein ACYS9Y_01635 [Planctomycetota bacterium]
MNPSSLMLKVMLITLIISTATQIAPADNDSELGLAAKYPGDKGIEKNPAVIFATGFEGQNKLAGFTQLRAPKTVSTSSEPKFVHSGKNSAQITATKGKDVGGALIYRWEKGVDQLYFRFYCRFHEETCKPHHFANIGANCPGRETEGHAGQRPKGHEGFSTTVEPPNDQRDWCLYTYWYQMHSWQNEDGTPNNPPDGDGRSFYGNVFNPLKKTNNFERGKWTCVEFLLKANSPGKFDGEQAVWINGKKTMHWKTGCIEGTWFRDKFRIEGPFNTNPKPFEGFNWRSDPNLKINRINLQWYVSNRALKRATVDRNIVHFDNVVIATEYIGPMVDDVSTKTKSPRADLN